MLLVVIRHVRPNLLDDQKEKEMLDRVCTLCGISVSEIGNINNTGIHLYSYDVSHATVTNDRLQLLQFLLLLCRLLSLRLVIFVVCCSVLRVPCDNIFCCICARGLFTCQNNNHNESTRLPPLFPLSPLSPLSRKSCKEVHREQEQREHQDTQQQQQISVSRYIPHLLDIPIQTTNFSLEMPHSVFFVTLSCFCRVCAEQPQSNFVTAAQQPQSNVVVVMLCCQHRNEMSIVYYTSCAFRDVTSFDADGHTKTYTHKHVITESKINSGAQFLVLSF